MADTILYYLKISYKNKVVHKILKIIVKTYNSRTHFYFFLTYVYIQKKHHTENIIYFIH